MRCGAVPLCRCAAWGTSPKALLDFDLKKHRMSMNVNIVIDDPEELERVRQKEMDITKDA